MGGAIIEALPLNKSPRASIGSFFETKPYFTLGLVIRRTRYYFYFYYYYYYNFYYY
jgi:hypothetical protein